MDLSWSLICETYPLVHPARMFTLDSPPSGRQAEGKPKYEAKSRLWLFTRTIWPRYYRALKFATDRRSSRAPIGTLHRRMTLHCIIWSAAADPKTGLRMNAYCCP